MEPSCLDLRLTCHYGIPSSSSVMAFDSIQRIFAVATAHGKIKIIGGGGVEYLLESSLQLPYRFLEFLDNQGYLLSITKENDIEVWNLDRRTMACSLQWDTCITAFSVLQGTSYMYIGDDIGGISVIKYNEEDETISRMPYHIPASILKDYINDLDNVCSSIVQVLPQPSLNTRRVLLAHSNGLIILWDISAACVISILGAKVNPTSSIVARLPSNLEDNNSLKNVDIATEGKEVCCACWISSEGSVVAAGYTDGDILFWAISSGLSNRDRNEDTNSYSNDVAKLQLTSNGRRLPVVMLRWSSNEKSCLKTGGGILYVYGGVEIGNPEIVMVLHVKWSDGLRNLECISFLHIDVHGSFSDMILLPDAGNSLMSPCCTLLVLTNPGQLFAYDGIDISNSVMKQTEMIAAPLQPVPIEEPLFTSCITVTKLVSLIKHSDASRMLSQLPRVLKSIAPSTLPSGTKWPVTGGVLESMSICNSTLETLLITGHENGNVNIWDASVPYLCLICSIENREYGDNITSSKSPISALEFCQISDILATGDQQGRVKLHKLSATSGESRCHIFTKDAKEDQNFHAVNGFNCIAFYDLHGSRIQSFAFWNEQVCFASENGLVTAIDLHSLEVMYTGKFLSSDLASVLSLSVITFSQNGPTSSTSEKTGEDITPFDAAFCSICFMLFTDGTLIAFDAGTGTIISTKNYTKKHSRAVALHIIGVTPDIHNKGEEVIKSPYKAEHVNENRQFQNEIEEGKTGDSSDSETQVDTDNLIESQKRSHLQMLDDFLLLICLEDSLMLLPAASIFEDDSKSICKVKLEMSCCWSSTFVDRDQHAVGISLLYESGLLEFRCLPHMDVLARISLNTLLCWNYDKSLATTISSSVKGRIALFHNKEMAYLSILANENDLRIPDSMPSLFDKDLAAAADAADAACKANSSPMKNKNPIQGFLGGVIKDIKGGVLKRASNSSKGQEAGYARDLSFIFQQCPFPEESKKEVQHEDLDIDDIEIDDFPSVSMPRYPDKRTDRQKLLEEKTEVAKPKPRTTEEIKAAYGHKKAHDASAIAGLAKDRLHERGEKLQNISKHTEELQAGAENFASMADELLKTMERRKWWQI